MKPLTRLVQDYIEAEGIEVIDTISLEIQNNIKVGGRDPMALVEVSQDLKVEGADAVVISACVQMPSLESIPAVEAGWTCPSSPPPSAPPTGCSSSSASRPGSRTPGHCCRGGTERVPARMLPDQRGPQ